MRSHLGRKAKDKSVEAIAKMQWQEDSDEMPNWQLPEDEQLSIAIEASLQTRLSVDRQLKAEQATAYEACLAVDKERERLEQERERLEQERLEQERERLQQERERLEQERLEQERERTKFVESYLCLEPPQYFFEYQGRRLPVSFKPDTPCDIATSYFNDRFGIKCQLLVRTAHGLVQLETLPMKTIIIIKAT